MSLRQFIRPLSQLSNAEELHTYFRKRDYDRYKSELNMVWMNVVFNNNNPSTTNNYNSAYNEVFRSQLETDLKANTPFNPDNK